MNATGQTIRFHRRPWLAAALLLVSAGLLSAAAAGTVRRPHPQYAYGHTWRPGDVVNLHVVANSDSAVDQAIKLKVRDAVTSALLPLIAGARTPDEVQATVLRNRVRLERVAARALMAGAGSGPVRIEVIAAGDNRAVRVVIGRGAGHNWWCVLYPPLCLVEGETASPASARAFSSRPTLSSDSTVDPPVEVRSALVEWWNATHQRLIARGQLGSLTR